MSPSPIDLIATLGVPLSEPLVQRAARIADPALWRHAQRWLDAETVSALWTQWHPELAARAASPLFIQALRRLLADGLALGYRVERFRDAALSWPEGAIGEHARIAAFEACIAGDDCARLRMWVSRSQFEWLRRDPRTAGKVPPDESWPEQLAMMADGLFYELGLSCCAPAIAVDETLQSPWVSFGWNDLRTPPRSSLAPGTAMVAAKAGELARLGITAEQTFNPASGNECALIDEHDRAAAEQAGLQTWSAQGHLLLMLSAVIREQAAALINRDLVELYRLRLREFYPALLAAVDQRFDIDFVTAVLRSLLADELSIRNLSAILQSLLELRAAIEADPLHIVFTPGHGGVFVGHDARTLHELEVADHVEQVRMGMRRYISHKYTRGQSTLVVHLLDAAAEQRLMRPGDVDDATAEAINGAAKSEFEGLTEGRLPLVLTTSEVRRKLQQVLRCAYPRAVALSYQELSPEMNIQPISRISPDFDDES